MLQYISLEVSIAKCPFEKTNAVTGSGSACDQKSSLVKMFILPFCFLVVSDQFVIWCLSPSEGGGRRRLPGEERRSQTIHNSTAPRFQKKKRPKKEGKKNRQTNKQKDTQLDSSKISKEKKNKNSFFDVHAFDTQLNS